MKKIIIIILVFKSITVFGQDKCRYCDSLLQLNRQGGGSKAFSKYNSSCFKIDTVFSDSTFYSASRAICSDLVTYTTYLKKNKKIISMIKVENKDTIYYIADKMPSFPSGEAGMMKFISKNVRYPEGCKKKNISGTVYISFIVNENGNITDIYPLISPDPELTSEVSRVVKLMPPWTPGEVKGKLVKVQFNLPVKFSL